MLLAAIVLGWICIAAVNRARAQTLNPPPPSLLAAWFAAQTNIHSWSAQFTQTRTLKSLTEPLTAQGRVWFAQPNRFRWELGDPPRTIAVRATNQMLVIYPRLKRAERYDLENAGQWRDALALLETGFPRSEQQMRSNFDILSQVISNQTCELTLQPKSASARKMMPQIRLAFSTNDFSLRTTELSFADGSTMRNDFKDPVLNPHIDDQSFTPALGADFKITEPLKNP